MDLEKVLSVRDIIGSIIKTTAGELFCTPFLSNQELLNGVVFPQCPLLNYQCEFEEFASGFVFSWHLKLRQGFNHNWDNYWESQLGQLLRIGTIIENQFFWEAALWRKNADGDSSFWRIYIYTLKKERWVEILLLNSNYIIYTNSITSKCHIPYERELPPAIKNNCILITWNSRVTEHIHWTMTRSKIKNCKMVPRLSNQWENAINGVMCLSKESELLSQFQIASHPPPPPLPAGSGGPLLEPHHLNPPPPPILWEMYPLDLGNWSPLLFTKKTCIIGLSQKSSRDKHSKGTPFPKKMGTHMLPLSLFEAGGLLTVSEFKIASLCLKLGICD